MKKITLLFFGLISIIGFSQNIDVVSGYTLTNIKKTNGSFTATNTNAVLGVENIIAALDSGPVTINASNNITINGSIYTDDIANYFNLKLNAGNTVLINNNINLGNGKLAITGTKSIKNTAELIAKNISLYSGGVNDTEILHSGKIKGESIHIESNCSGHVTITGSINATKSVIVTGEYVYIKDDSNISAFNEFGGGKILIGGDKLGLNPEVQNAENVYIGPNATLSSSAEISGQGGKLIVYSNNKTINLGNLSANGIAEASGGFIETSGKNHISLANAPEIGNNGSWLIDPNNIEIVPDGTINPDNINISGFSPFETTNDGAQIEAGLMLASLSGGSSVNMTTTSSGSNSQVGDITLNAMFNYNSTGNNTLTLNAANDIFINETITSTGSDQLTLNLNPDFDSSGNGDVFINNTVDLNGRNMTIEGSGNMVSNATATHVFELNSTTVGTGYNQILHTGSSNTLTLNNANLSLNLGQTFNIGDSFVIFSGFNSLSGQFAQGSSITVGFNEFSINYNANDITLTVTNNTLSIDDAPELNTISVFPNPAKNTIFINNPNQIEINELIIHDITGRIVKNKSLLNSETDVEIDVSKLSKGSYIILINTKKNVYSKKVIIN